MLAPQARIRLPGARWRRRRGRGGAEARDRGRRVRARPRDYNAVGKGACPVVCNTHRPQGRRSAGLLCFRRGPAMFRSIKSSAPPQKKKGNRKEPQHGLLFFGPPNLGSLLHQQKWDFLFIIYRGFREDDGPSIKPIKAQLMMPVQPRTMFNILVVPMQQF